MFVKGTGGTNRLYVYIGRLHLSGPMRMRENALLLINRLIFILLNLYLVNTLHSRFQDKPSLHKPFRENCIFDCQKKMSFQVE